MITKNTANTLRVAGLTSVAMLAFAGNSVLCRLALRSSDMDPMSFTTIRLLSGSILLVAVVLTRPSFSLGGSWMASLYLFGYAAGFSLAYIYLPASVGALLLFGAVQVTMISTGFFRSERLSIFQWLGFLLAFGGLVVLLLPGLASPTLLGSLLMIVSGVCWGLYSLQGVHSGDATKATAGNFLRASLFAIVFSLFFIRNVSFNTRGFFLAVASGALTSGLGYAIWYAAVKHLKSSEASVVQLSVPVLAALIGFAFLGEPLSLSFVLASGIVLGGISVALFGKRRQTRAPGDRPEPETIVETEEP